MYALNNTLSMPAGQQMLFATRAQKVVVSRARLWGNLGDPWFPQSRLRHNHLFCALDTKIIILFEQVMQMSACPEVLDTTALFAFAMRHIAILLKIKGLQRNSPFTGTRAINLVNE